MKVDLKQPGQDEELTMVITETEGYEYAEQGHDTELHRCVIAFFKEKPGAPSLERKLTFRIRENGQGESHTVTAIAVSGTTVMATDRKRIRSGQPKP